MKAYTLYFYSQNKSCIAHFPVDARSKERALKMGKGIAKLILDYYKADEMPWLTKVIVEAEEYVLFSGLDIKPYLQVKDKVWRYYYLCIDGGTGDRSGHGGQYKFYLTYLRLDQRRSSDDSALDYYCKDKGIPCGVGDTIELAHADFQQKLLKTPLK